MITRPLAGARPKLPKLQGALATGLGDVMNPLDPRDDSTRSSGCDTARRSRVGRTPAVWCSIGTANREVEKRQDIYV